MTIITLYQAISLIFLILFIAEFIFPGAFFIFFILFTFIPIKLLQITKNN